MTIDQKAKEYNKGFTETFTDENGNTINQLNPDIYDAVIFGYNEAIKEYSCTPEQVKSMREALSEILEQLQALETVVPEVSNNYHAERIMILSALNSAPKEK